MLDAVEHRHEEFVVERHGRVVAALAPGGGAPGHTTWGDVLTLLREDPRPDREFARDVRRAQRRTGPAAEGAVGTLVDTSVLIEIERGAPPLDPTKEVAIAAITASALLRGVLRADAVHRAQRESFVEALLATVPTIPFSLRIARVHAGLWAQLAASHRTVAPHDLIVAATAISLGWALATLNRRHFAGIPALTLATESQPS